MYFDHENGCYMIPTSAGARYYSPEIRQFISPAPPEEMLGNAGVIGGLYAYALAVDNPVNLAYNGHTIEPNGDLAFDPSGRSVSGWTRFWRSGWGHGLAIGLFVLAVAATMGKAAIGGASLFGALLAGGKTALKVGFMLTVSGVIAGFTSMGRGSPFSAGFTDFITNDWAQSVAIGSFLIAATAGIGLAQAGMAKAKVPNGVIPYKPNSESLVIASQGNPSPEVFKVRYWKAEAARAPYLYGGNVAAMLKTGKAPVINGEKLVIHHVYGRGIPTELFNVAILPHSKHVSFHASFGGFHAKGYIGRNPWW